MFDSWKLPESEAGNEPRRCKGCFRTSAILQYGSAQFLNIPSNQAIFDQVISCLRNRPIIGAYHGILNNCNDWAAEAGQDCGVYCP